jgi:hypothetical protein
MECEEVVNKGIVRKICGLLFRRLVRGDALNFLNLLKNLYLSPFFCSSVSSAPALRRETLKTM